MKNFALAAMARDEAGLCLGLAVMAVGVALVLVLHPLPVVAGLMLVAVGAVLALGGLLHVLHVQAVQRRNPPPGRMIDLGGYRVHLLAEGEAKGRPAVVWFPGAHGASFELHHLHRALRGDTRSILIDRPGTGWSDAGPFPRTTAREAEEMVLALQRAGETGPFVWVGHSFGGLLAANIARRHPELTAAVVLLDATPLDTIVYGPRLGALGAMKRDAFNSALRALFGLHRDRNQERLRAGGPYAELLARIDAVVGPEVVRSRELNARTRVGCAGASIYGELSPEGVAACAWETSVYDGDLDPLKVYLVAPGESPEVKALAEMSTASPVDAARMMRFFPATRERYLAASSRSERVITPAGTGHNFPYEAPEFTAEAVRRALG